MLIYLAIPLIKNAPSSLFLANSSRDDAAELVGDSASLVVLRCDLAELFGMDHKADLVVRVVNAKPDSYIGHHFQKLRYIDNNQELPFFNSQPI